MTRQDLRLHDFVVTDDKSAAQIIAMTHEALKVNHLAGEVFDVSPGQAVMAFREAVRDVA